MNSKRKHILVNPDSFISSILAKTDCRQHKVEIGVPCFLVPSLAGSEFHQAICNRRARRAGFTGRINPLSLRKK